MSKVRKRDEDYHLYCRRCFLCFGWRSAWPRFRRRRRGLEPSSASPRSSANVPSAMAMPPWSAPPRPAAIRQMPPERIYAALTTGVMKTQAANLNDEQKRRLAEYMGGRPLGSAALGDASQMPNHCPAEAAMPDPAKSPAWNGWGVDVHNTRFQNAEAAGITAAQIPGLKLKWAFGFPLGVSAFGQPSVAGGTRLRRLRYRICILARYAHGLRLLVLSNQSGGAHCDYDRALGQRGLARDTPFISATCKPTCMRWTPRPGALLWTRRVEDHFSARITAAPTLYQGRLYVPVSTSEGFSASTLDYPCCTFRGSVVALNAQTGDQVWKAYTIPEPKPTKKNSIGTQFYAPSGVAVWNSPTVDAKRHAIYFGDGDSATEPAPETSDSILAVDMDSGKLRWHFQAEPNDATLGGCFGKNKTENCPEQSWPRLGFWRVADFEDAAERPRSSAGAQQERHRLCVGSRIARAPWSGRRISPKRREHASTNLVWGGSADRQNLYVGLVTGAITAVQICDRREALDHAPGAARKPRILCRGEQRDPGRGLHRRDGR